MNWKFAQGQFCVLFSKGRTSLLLPNRCFHGHPPIIIRKEDHKEDFVVLEVWDTRQKPALFQKFFRRQTEKTPEKQIASAEEQQG